MKAPITDRPILFSAPMIRALLAGTKTQTRRVVKPQPPSNCVRPMAYEGIWTWEYLRHGVHVGPMCPYGVPGETLWVKETHASTAQAGDHASDAHTVYRATDPGWSIMDGWKWKPSIFMRRADSRISLRVTSVRVERVQDISEEDALAEGIKPWGPAQRGVYGMTLENVGPVYPSPAADIIAGGESWTTSAARSFRGLWVSINGAESWESNPFVWVVGFERVESAVLAQLGGVR